MRPFVKRAASCAATLAAGAALCLGMALEPTQDYYVNDYADVLSQSTEDEIIEKNIALENASGAQIVVVTVDSTQGLSAEEFAYEVANDWGIGSAKEDNGVLLLLDIGGQDYQCIQGRGLEDTLTTATLSRILQEDLEPDFAAGDYDAGVQKTFDSLYSQVAAIYGTSPGGQAQPGRPERRGSDAGIIVGFLVLLVLFILVVNVVTRGGGSSGSGHRGGGTGGGFWTGYFLGSAMHRHRRPPPPPGGFGGFGGRPGGSFRGGGGGFGGFGGRSGGSFRGGGGGFRGGGAGRGH